MPPFGFEMQDSSSQTPHDGDISSEAALEAQRLVDVYAEYAADKAHDSLEAMIQQAEMKRASFWMEVLHEIYRLQEQATR